jgi:transposase InsO family protein
VKSSLRREPDEPGDLLCARFGVPCVEVVEAIDSMDKVDGIHAAGFRFNAKLRYLEQQFEAVLTANLIRLAFSRESGNASAMGNMLKLVWWAAVGLFRSRTSLEAEILTLRNQLNVLRRKSPKRLAFSNFDRLVFAGLYWIAPGVVNALVIVEPETVIRWHRAGFRLFWRWKSRCRGGRPKVPLEIRLLIRDMSLANPLWGAPRIHGELLKLGIEIGQTSVAKYMARHRRPPSQGWRTFLRNHADGIASMDLFVVPTLSFRLLFGLLIMLHGRRQMLWLGVTAHPTAEWIARQLPEACGWEPVPRPIIRDRDSVYGEIFKRRLHAMGIRDRPTAPRSPWQNGHTERLIGSIRRECLDHVVVFGERHLRHVLLSYMQYYNDARTHLSLNKDAPAPRAVQAVGHILPAPILGGLHHHYVRI